MPCCNALTKMMPMLLAGLIINTPAWAVYRCAALPGQAPTYSQWPCEARGQPIKVDDPRSSQQAAQARRDHAQAQKAAKQFDRRMRQEARARRKEHPTAIDGPVRQVSVGQPEARDKPPRRRKHLTKDTDQAERTFRAVQPKNTARVTP